MSVRGSSNSSSSVEGGGNEHCNLTPMLVRDAVEELEKWRHRVTLSLLLTHFQRCMPVQQDDELLKNEILEQAAKAVKLGYLRQYSDGSYCLSTFRWQASVNEFGYD